MEELSTAQMLALRGGTGPAAVISFGNFALAMPIDIIVLSGNAVGPGAQSGIGNILQTATATAGTQLLNLLGK
jgi:SpoU rRNA methylase family enzyme